MSTSAAPDAPAPFTCCHDSGQTAPAGPQPPPAKARSARRHSTISSAKQTFVITSVSLSAPPAIVAIHSITFYFMARPDLAKQRLLKLSHASSVSGLGRLQGR